jgi:hypothetical protein
MRVQPPQSSPDDNDDLSSLYSHPSIQNSSGGWPSVKSYSPGSSVRTLNQSDDGTYRDDISLANYSNEDLDPSDRDSVFTVDLSASPSITPPRTPRGSSRGQYQPPSHLRNILPAPNTVDRTTYLQNALYQLQEQGSSTRAAVDIPLDTYNRQVKNVRACIMMYASTTSAQSVVCFSQVAQPVASRPTEEQFWMNDQYGRRKPNAELLRDHFLHEGRLTEVQALAILRQSTDVLAAEPNVLKVKSPMTGMSL